MNFPTLTTTDSLLERLHLIPDDLIGPDQWVVWRAEHTKVPYQPRRPRRKAKANDPATWGTFAEAVNTFADWLGRDDQFTGIGYEFSADDPFVGVDLDDCKRGDTIHPAAVDIIRSLGGYAEISPSETGVKIWTRATIPDGIVENTGYQKKGMPWGGQIEVYRHGRFFAVTGRRVEL